MLPWAAAFMVATAAGGGSSRKRVGAVVSVTFCLARALPLDLDGRLYFQVQDVPEGRSYPISTWFQTQRQSSQRDGERRVPDVASLISSYPRSGLP